MKTIFKYLLLASVLLIYSGCSKKEEPKLETFSAEAFAYDMETSWEINSSIRVKGFAQAEEGKSFKHSLTYSVSLITPSGEVIKGLDSGEINDAPAEKPADLSIEVQYELNKTNGPGKYKIVYEIKDELAGKTAKGEKDFEVM